MRSLLVILGWLLAAGPLWAAPFVVPVSGGSASMTWVSAGANLSAVKQASSPSATADWLNVVGPGLYPNATNLLKNRVHWHFMSGAVTSNLVQRAGTDAWNGTFDDRISGAVTSSITGYGTFIYDMSDYDLGGIDVNTLGFLVLTNPASRVSFQGRRVEMFAQDITSGIQAAFSIRNCRQFFIDLDEIENMQYGENDGVDAQVSGMYWVRGDVFGRISRIKTEGYGVWCDTALDNLGVTNDLYLTGDRWQTTSLSAIYTSMSNATHRSWFKVGELLTSFGGFSTISLYDGGRTYIDALKIDGRNQQTVILADNAYATGVFGCESWITAQKISSDTRWLIVRSGAMYINAQQYEDTGTVDYGFRLTNGITTISGGVAKVLAGHGVEIFGGTNRFIGVTIDTRNAGATTAVTNYRPITLVNNASNLVLNGCSLLSPIATANGGAYNIFGTSGVAHVIMAGSGTGNSNNSGIVVVNPTLLLTNLPQLR